MKITVTFDSLEEFQDHMAPKVGPPIPVEAAPTEAPQPETPTMKMPKTETPVDIEIEASLQAEAEPVEAPAVPQKPQKQKTTASAKKAEKPAQTEAAPQQDSPGVSESFRIETRKQLAALNRKAGFNRAAEIIKEVTGAEAKLTEVPLDALPRIMEMARGEFNAD